MNTPGKDEKLWLDYLFLTNEIVKFLNKQDFELIIELLEQREKLQQQIEQLDDQPFRCTEKGQEVLRTIQQTEQGMKIKLEFLRNTSKRQMQVSDAYEGFSSPYIGKRMDRQT
ncbi:hypothetical protein SPFL3102_01658 [Sporomusaceae bacterium FL31]|nr:hypothetical protein SPFL3101_03292 [Sporomusaceae bacterium FL31]GCE33849.1 hypothetical protein SPFL3102_01658 [Sporomusaceae bacterium]